MNDAPEQLPAANTEPEKEQSCRSILIVDDEEFVRNALRRALRREGYQLHFADGPEAGLELLKQTPVDLVMSDQMMPGMTGTEFLSLVRDRCPDTVRILLTGHADMDVAIKAINHGEIYRFLSKPWDDLELKLTLYLAFERLALERQNRRLLFQLRRQQIFLGALEREHPGILQVVRDERGAIVLSEDELSKATAAAI
ncbi:MAG: response regulator [Deltaproteobacteria bacterium]|nr:response regulator [Deltaproteobacteria bacterium]